MRNNVLRVFSKWANTGECEDERVATAGSTIPDATTSDPLPPPTFCFFLPPHTSPKVRARACTAAPHRHHHQHTDAGAKAGKTKKRDSLPQWPGRTPLRGTPPWRPFYSAAPPAPGPAIPPRRPPPSRRCRARSGRRRDAHVQRRGCPRPSSSRTGTPRRMPVGGEGGKQGREAEA